MTRPGTLSIAVTPAQETALVAELFDAKQKKITRKAGARSEGFTLDAKVAKGTYRLKLTSSYTVEAAGKGELPAALTTPYTLTTTRR